jgi:hypothetical protein
MSRYYACVRYLRWPIRVLCILSALLCVAAIAGSLVPSSYSLASGAAGRPVHVWFDCNRLWFGWYHRQPIRVAWAGQINRLGFCYNRYSNGDGYLSMPSWYLSPPCGALAVIIPCCARLRQLRLPGTCAKCGYDLRATPERCPECGTIPAAKTHAISS